MTLIEPKLLFTLVLFIISCGEQISESTSKPKKSDKLDLVSPNTNEWTENDLLKLHGFIRDFADDEIWHEFEYKNYVVGEKPTYNNLAGLKLVYGPFKILYFEEVGTETYVRSEYFSEVQRGRLNDFIKRADTESFDPELGKSNPERGFRVSSKLRIFQFKTKLDSLPKLESDNSQQCLCKATYNVSPYNMSPWADNFIREYGYEFRKTICIKIENGQFVVSGDGDKL